MQRLKTLSEVLRRKVLTLFGEQIQKIGYACFEHKADYHYCPKVFGASHHKVKDPREHEPFASLAAAVVENRTTLLYYDRLFSLYQGILNVMRSNEEHVNIAEVGVYRGGSTYFMASVIQDLFPNRATVHGFDTFEGHPGDIDKELEGSHHPGLFGDTSLEQVEKLLSDFENVHLHKGLFQDTCGVILDKRFSLVHMDVDIYSATRDGLDIFDGLVIPGGIILVDDYGFKTCPGCRKAVDDFLAARKNYFSLELNTGQAVLVKVN
jgi:O-methyltransferase